MKAPPETVSVKTTKFGKDNEKVKIYEESDFMFTTDFNDRALEKH